MTFILMFWQIYPVNQYEFAVHHLKEQYAPNILNHTCSCSQWDLDMIPCVPCMYCIIHKEFSSAYVH